MREERSIRMVKLHGSVNWFRLIGASRVGKTWFQAVQEMDVTPLVNTSSIHVKEWHEPVINYTKDLEIDENFIYPVLTAPLAGKGSTATVCPEAHLAIAAEWLEDCRNFLIIGVSGFDEDLLSILNSAVDEEPHFFTLSVLINLLRRLLSDFNLKCMHSTFAGSARSYNCLEVALKDILRREGLRHLPDLKRYKIRPIPSSLLDTKQSSVLLDITLFYYRLWV